MPTPEVESLPQWLQYALGGLAFFGMAGSMVMRFLDGRKVDPEAGKHVIVEQAELADLSVIRSIAPKLEQIYMLGQKLDAQQGDLDAMADRQRQILEILGRMDRKEEMRALIREERRNQDDGGAPRR